MVKKMLINASHPEECRVAVVSDGVLEEIGVEIKTREATLGNIYKGVIDRVEPSLQAVFVDYGAARNGFLSISDVHPSYCPDSFSKNTRRPRIEEVFRKGDEVVVQVIKEERDTKGACLSTNISLAGRYLVLMPGTDLHGVSRKIDDDKERKKLKEIVKQLRLPDNMGFIIRTAGKGRTKTELSNDFKYLLNLWKNIEKTIAEIRAPAILHREQDVVIRSIRDHLSADISSILIDDPAVYDQAKEFFRAVMPKQEKLVKLYQEKRPIFNKYQLEEQVESIYQKRINLKSGGYIIIEPTEAVVTIDVNSGGATKEKGVEETAFRVNKEAAAEVGRQLRLRDLGGIIIIDFIDMMSKKHNLEVEKILKSVLKDDRAKSKVLKISALGVLELSRQRLQPSLGTGEYLECPNCGGHGKIRSPEMSALSVYRKIKSLAIKPDVSELRATVPPKVAEYLLNRMRHLLTELESKHNARVLIFSNSNGLDYGTEIESVKKTASDAKVAEMRPQLACAEEAEQQIEDEKPPDEKKKSRRSSRRRKSRSRRKPTAANANGNPDDSQEMQEQAAGYEGAAHESAEPSVAENGTGEEWSPPVDDDPAPQTTPEHEGTNRVIEHASETSAGNGRDLDTGLEHDTDSSGSESSFQNSAEHLEAVSETSGEGDETDSDISDENENKKQFKSIKSTLKMFLPFS